MRGEGEVVDRDTEPVVRDRAALEARYLQLVRHDLPEAARRGRWVLRLDHCFGRVLLDDAVGGCWYDVLGRGRTPAFRRLSDDRLVHAVATGEGLLVAGPEEGGRRLVELDARSLAWRGKPPKTPRTRT